MTPENAINILIRASRGEKQSSIAADYGVTRQRIHQIVSAGRAYGEPIAPAISLVSSELPPNIRSWFLSQPNAIKTIAASITAAYVEERRRATHQLLSGRT